MAELAAYSARFDFGRLFADAGRVFARGWPAIALGLALLSTPIVIAALPWWRGPADTAPETYRRVWGAVNLAKAVLILITYAASSAFVAAVSLKTLTGAAWRDMLRPRRLAAGFATALCLDLVSNWVTLVGPVAALFTWQITGAAGWLSYLSILITLCLMTFVGVAVSAAVAEQRFVGGAFARSARLLRGLRWRIVSLGFGYMLVLALGEIAVGLALTIAHVSYLGPGPGRVVMDLAALAMGAAGDVAFVAFFLQARRIADGPTARELHEVFA